LNPSSLAVDAAGNLYISDIGIVRRVTTDGNITTFAGIESTGFGGDGGPATAARLGSFIDGITLDPSGNVYRRLIQQSNTPSDARWNYQ
jgi:hypothetical protein